MINEDGDLELFLKDGKVKRGQIVRIERESTWKSGEVLFRDKLILKTHQTLPYESEKRFVVKSYEMLDRNKMLNISVKEKEKEKCGCNVFFEWTGKIVWFSFFFAAIFDE